MLQRASNSSRNAKRRTFVFAGRRGTSEGSQTLRNNRKSQENDQNFTKPPFQGQLDFQGSPKPPLQNQLDAQGPPKSSLQGQLGVQGALGDLLCANTSLPLPAWPALPARSACLASKNRANLTSKSPRYRRSRANLTSKGPRNRRHKANSMSKGP